MVKTRQAWIGKKEVVEVVYDPKVVKLEQLRAFAKRKEFWFEPEATEAAGKKDRPPLRMDKEQKYYLLQSALKKVPMSEAQACRVNASLKGNWKQYLSPSQLKQADLLLKPKEKKQRS